MIMNAISVKVNNKSILIPTYKCRLVDTLETVITEEDFELHPNDQIIGNNVIIGETELKVEITAIADSTIDTTARVG
jgi:hypothetical protein